MRDYTTAEWKALAYECKRLRDFTCQRCGRRFKPWEHFKLEAHHPPEAYAKENRGEKLSPWDLVPLCGKQSGSPCHVKGRLSRFQIQLDRDAVWIRNALEWGLRRAPRAIGRGLLWLTKRGLRLGWRFLRWLVRPQTSRS